MYFDNKGQEVVVLDELCYWSSLITDLIVVWNEATNNKCAS